MQSSSVRLVAVINAARCTGCGWCVPSCHVGLLSLVLHNWRKTSALSDAAACTGCRKCVSKCPFGVISMAERSALPEC